MVEFHFGTLDVLGWTMSGQVGLFDDILMGVHADQSDYR